MKTEKIVPGARFMANTNITESPQLLLSIDSVRALSGWATNQAVNMEPACVTEGVPKCHVFILEGSWVLRSSTHILLKLPSEEDALCWP